MTWRRIASLVVLIGALLVGAQLFNAASHGPVPVEIHYLLGDPPVASGLDVVFSPAGGGPAVARFETRLVGPDVKQTTRLPAGAQVMDITIVGPGGERHSIQRTIEASRGAVIRLDLSRGH